MSKLYEDWSLLSVRIKALASLMPFVDDSNTDGMASLKESLKSCKEDIETFNKCFKQSLNEVYLPYEERCIDLLEKFLEAPLWFGSSLELRNIRKTLTNLSILDAEISFLLNNTQSRIRKTVEIAFAHLQRLITADASTADASVAKAWQDAFKKRETVCEKLGGAHLLLHKIWGFKIKDNGSETDLVLQEAINKEDPLYQSVDGLVLTEWKKVGTKDDINSKIKEAQKQAELYKNGILSPLVLFNYYYLVMVSEKAYDVSSWQNNPSLKFRVINIVVDPDCPSAQARRG